MDTQKEARIACLDQSCQETVEPDGNAVKIQQLQNNPQSFKDQSLLKRNIHHEKLTKRQQSMKTDRSRSVCFPDGKKETFWAGEKQQSMKTDRPRSVCLPDSKKRDFLGGEK